MARKRAPSMPMLLGYPVFEISEATLQSDILTYLGLLGIPAWSTHSSRNHPETPGMADVIGVLPGGRFLAIECKAQDGRTTEAQVAWLRDVHKAGGLAFVARDLDTVQNLIETHRRSL